MTPGTDATKPARTFWGGGPYNGRAMALPLGLLAHAAGLTWHGGIACKRVTVVSFNGYSFDRYPMTADECAEFLEAAMPLAP